MIRPEMLCSSWPQKPLGEVVEFLDHLRRPVTAIDRSSGPYPYYGANGQQDSVAEYIFDEPLILMAEDGGYFGDPDRTIAYRVDGKCWVNNHAHVLRPKDGVDIGFLCKQLEKYDVTRFIKGATRQKLNKSSASEIPITLPPLAEQKRIAAILDKADAIRRKRRQAIKLADEFLRAVFLDMFGDPVTNPKGYNSASLGDLVEIISGGTPSKAEKSFWNGMFPWVSPKDMKSIIINDSIDKISENVFSETPLKRIPQKSILIVIRGMILVHTIPIAITEKEVAINQDIKALIPKQSIVPQFLLWSLIILHNFLLSKVSTAAHGTKRLDMESLRNIDILLPTIVQQNQFVEITNKFSSVKSGQTLSLEQNKAMFDSLSQRAFRGEL